MTALAAYYAIACLFFCLGFDRPQPTARPGLWPADLGKPTDPMATTYAARAHSVLHSLQVRDPRGLPREQAVDVLRWAGQPV